MTDRTQRTVPVWLGLAAVALVALNLRPGATSIGPALPDLMPGLGMSPAVAGVLTALPGLCFGLFGAVAVWLATRFGLAGATAAGLVAIVGGLAGRVLVSSPPLFLGLSAVALGGAAIGNILVPAFVKRHFPQRTAALMGVYTVSLAVGALLPGLLHPLVRVSGGWQASLGLWAAVALLALVPWLVLATGERHHRGPGHTVVGRSIWSVARSGKAIALAAFFGCQSLQAYVGFGWISQILVDAQVSVTTASLAMAVFSAWGLPSGALAPVLANLMPDRRPLIVVCTALLVAGWTGLLVAPASAPYLWVSLLGASGFAFPLVLYLITDVTRDLHVTSALSGFTQSTGYVLAATGPFLVGILHSLTHGWSVPLWFLLLTAVPFCWSGWYAAKPGYVDDELPASLPRPEVTS